MRIAAIFRIEDPAQGPHGIEIILCELLLHEINLFDTNAVLAGNAAAEFNAFFQNVLARREGLRHLVRLAFIIKNQRMNIAVAGMKDIRDAQTKFLARALNETHDFRHSRARDDSVLREEIRAEPAYRAERA